MIDTFQYIRSFAPNLLSLGNDASISPLGTCLLDRYGTSGQSPDTVLAWWRHRPSRRSALSLYTSGRYSGLGEFVRMQLDKGKGRVLTTKRARCHAKHRGYVDLAVGFAVRVEAVQI